MRTVLMQVGITVSFLLMAEDSSALWGQEAGQVTTEVRIIQNGADDEIRCELGTIYVHENRSDPESRLIGVGFARFPAVGERASAPPVFRLPGGPGGSFVSRIRSANATQLDATFPELIYLRGTCDVIYVDQRGYSEAGDQFRVAFELPAREADQPMTLEREIDAFRRFAQETVDGYAEQGIDLSGYQVKECAADVKELATALGYEKITLCGTSFGSQWSFAVIQLYPELVARALLSGVEPINHGYDMPSHVFAAMRRMWQSLEQDRRFQAYLPEGGFDEAARSVIERLEKEPIKIYRERREDVEPKLVGVLGPEDFPWHDPVQILELYHGKTSRWAFQFSTQRARQQSMALIGPLIDSSLAVTPDRKYQLWTDPAIRYMGRDNFARYMATAEIWPSPDVGDEFRTPKQCDIPVVFTQGDWDFQTPIENTLEIAPYFTNSRVLIAHRGGHGVIQPIAREDIETWKQLVEFLQTGDMADIPSEITLSPSRRFRAPAFDLPDD